MPAPAEFHAGFAAGLRGGELPPGLAACPAEAAEIARRFAVYRNNVAVSLVAALARRFPVIRRLVGEAFFDQMARIFIAQHPPHSPVLLEWGAAMPEFLSGFPPLARHPYLADVARIEVARGAAFHAADAPPLAPAALAGADPAGLRLGLHPALRILPLDFAAVDVWARNQPGAAPRPIDIARPQIALILRDRRLDVPVRAISAADRLMLDRLRAGRTLLASAEAAAATDPAHDAAALLLQLARDGALVAPADGVLS
ncbi:HvfC/BufC N-terminal domain-containing protein [Paracoccus spongiarum]|uniref:DNA-binding domain-containing protein n=1 Tax=Paracoccus spongiarum TaxID=3064387 RepID=A0ABT9JBC1_9RHOB|nr:DNA-binding domain-containing protein [Paracoccus sp. 2205BS29-5]MDP5307116.1 DNA-binding domain-containing protein [Paracoccus sp. 2205BS29-5]